MKTLVTKIWVVMSMCLAVSFASCSTDNVFGDEEDWYTPTAPADTTTTPTPEPEIPEDSIDWSREMQKSFGYNRTTGEWPSTILVHYTNGKDSLWIHNCPMSTMISGPREIIVDSTAAPSRFVSSTIISTNSTPWMPENAPVQERLVTTQWAVNMTNFTDTITATHVEARIQIAGHEVLFLHGNEAQNAPSKRDDTPTAGAEVEIDGKTYTVEIANISMDHKLHASFQTNVQWSTRVLREKTVPEEKEVTPDPMPTPDLKVSAYGNVNNITFSPEFVGGNNVVWHKVCLTRNTINGVEYFSIWVDGSFVRTVELNAAEANNKYNSAYYAEGTWVPAILKYSSANDGGWDYSFVVNGEAKIKTVDQRMALTSGLSNFKKDNNASQTPSVLTTTSVKDFNGKKFVTVNGFDKDNRPVITFTIGECL